MAAKMKNKDVIQVGAVRGEQPKEPLPTPEALAAELVLGGREQVFNLAKKAFQEGWSWTRFEREYHNLPTEA